MKCEVCVDGKRLEHVSEFIFLGCVLEESGTVGRPQKSWIDTVKECLKKRGLNFKQTRRMVNDRSAWRGFVRDNAWDVARGMKF